MRNKSIFWLLILIQILNSSWALSSEKKKDFISGKKRYVGKLLLEKEIYYLSLNHNTETPFKIILDINKMNGLKSFVGNFLDLELGFKKTCSKKEKCLGKIMKYNGIYPAYKKIPKYRVIEQ